ncbi:MAG: cellobiose phosphorylase [Chloroflexi bacterium]|nr:cellobiose phosphorylase [Chloroflexota bacterium]
MQNWRFVDDTGTFVLENPQQTSYLYFPLVNEAGLMSCITPLLHGDIKTGQNSFLMSPVSVEDLHNTHSVRNFWVSVPGKGVWSAAGDSAAQRAQTFETDPSERVSLEAGFLWHKVTRENDQLGLRTEITNFVPAGADQVELMRVTLINTGDQPVHLVPTAAIPIYGRSADNLRDHRHVTSLLHRIRTHTGGVLVCPTLSFDERGHTINQITYAVLGAEADGTPPVEFFPVMQDFVGEGGTLDWPEAVVQPGLRGCSAGQSFDGYEAVGALRFKEITLLPGDSRQYVLILAILPKNGSTDELLAAYGTAAQFDAALADCRSRWQTKANVLTFRSADSTFDNWMRWVVIQPVLRRLYGNSFLPYHDYGRGGRGWRDLWQDCLALLLTEPDEVPYLLYSSFAGVRIDGSNATIIGSGPGEFLADRNNIPRVWMDHGAWPFLTTRLYIDQSGDLAFLLKEQTYFKDSHISRAQAQDEQWTPEQGMLLLTPAGEPYRGSVLEHLLVQHLTAFFHVGEHNIIRLEGADWNDGMDMARQRGESVAFTALYASNLRDLSVLVRELASLGISQVTIAAELLTLLDTLNTPVNYDDAAAKRQRLAAYFAQCQHTLTGEKSAVTLSDLAHDLATKADWLYAHLGHQEWIQDRAGFGWFNGYYDNGGHRVEGDHSDGVRMTLTGQVFTLMGGIATNEQVREIVRAADRYLLEPAMGGYRLNTHFGDIQLNLGRCFGFAFGDKENGAMFSHMAVMYANALYQRGLVPEGYKVLKDITDHCQNFATSRIYPGIPEYINARGRGMYPFLTGSASWLLLTLVTQVFGVRGQQGHLVIEPKLVPEQFDEADTAQILTLFAGKRLEVTFHNPARLNCGEYRVNHITLDGTEVAFDRVDNAVIIGRDLIESRRDQQPRLRVELGPSI